MPNSRRRNPTVQRYLTDYDDTASGWERALYAFLVEKQRRSGSERTTQA